LTATGCFARAFIRGNFQDSNIDAQRLQRVWVGGSIGDTVTDGQYYDIDAREGQFFIADLTQRCWVDADTELWFEHSVDDGVRAWVG